MNSECQCVGNVSALRVQYVIECWRIGLESEYNSTLQIKQNNTLCNLRRAGIVQTANISNALKFTTSQFAYI